MTRLCTEGSEGSEEYFMDLGKYRPSFRDVKLCV